MPLSQCCHHYDWPIIVACFSFSKALSSLSPGFLMCIQTSLCLMWPFPLPFHILQVPPIDVSSLIMFSRLLRATGLRGRQGWSPHWGAEGLRGPASADRGESWVATWGVQWWPLWAGWLLKWKILRIWNKTADGFICLQEEEGSVVRRVVFKRSGGARLLGSQKKGSFNPSMSCRSCKVRGMSKGHAKGCADLFSAT